MLADIRLDEDGEMRVIGIEATLALRMNLYEEEETEILSDMYSLEQQCAFDTQETVLEELLMQNQSKCKISERLSLPELKEDVLQILHSRWQHPGRERAAHIGGNTRRGASCICHFCICEATIQSLTEAGRE